MVYNGNNPDIELVDAAGNTINNVLEWNDETEEALLGLSATWRGGLKPDFVTTDKTLVVTKVLSLVQDSEEKCSDCAPAYFQPLTVRVRIPGAKIVKV